MEGTEDQTPHCKEPSTKIRIVTLTKANEVSSFINCKEPSTKIRIVTNLISLDLIVTSKLQRTFY